MSESAAPRLGSPFLVLIAALVLATAAALFASSGDPLLSLTPALSVLALLWIRRAPLAQPAMVLFALALLLENPYERPAAGMWRSALAPYGEMLFENLNKQVAMDWLRFSVLDAAVAALALIAWRRSRGFAPGGLLGLALKTSLAAIIVLEAWGLARGGDFKNSLWQIRELVYVPLLVLIFSVAFREQRHIALLGVLIVLAALFKAGMGIYFYEVICRPLNTQPPYVTTHSDSVLFVIAVMVVILRWFERRDLTGWLLCLISLPLIVRGMMINNRRLAYVSLAAVMALAFALLPRSPLKRKMTRLAALAVPIAAIYFVVGWGASARIFRPVQVARSVILSETDRSTQTRDIENYNLLQTLKMSPLLGQGFGHEYLELSKADDISRIFQQYRYIPHNSLLGLWAFGGLVGFSAIWMPLVAGVFLALRSQRLARDPLSRSAALVCAAVVITYALQAFGDMGLQSAEGAFLLAAALAVAGRLALRTGAWPVRPLPQEAAPEQSPLELQPPRAWSSS